MLFLSYIVTRLTISFGVKVRFVKKEKHNDIS